MPPILMIFFVTTIEIYLKYYRLSSPGPFALREKQIAQADTVPLEALPKPSQASLPSTEVEAQIAPLETVTESSRQASAENSEASANPEQPQDTKAVLPDSTSEKPTDNSVASKPSDEPEV